MPEKIMIRALIRDVSSSLSPLIRARTVGSVAAELTMCQQALNHALVDENLSEQLVEFVRFRLKALRRGEHLGPMSIGEVLATLT